MPTIEDLTKILSEMDQDSYRAAVKFIYFLMDDQQNKEKELLKNQKAFIEETAGKITVDEVAINEIIDSRLKLYEN